MTDTYRFPVIHNGTHFLMGSLSDHLRAGIPTGTALLISPDYRTRQVPAGEVTYRLVPVNWPRRKRSRKH